MPITAQQDIDAVANALMGLSPGVAAQINQLVTAEDMGASFFTGNPQVIFKEVDAVSGLNLAQKPYANTLGIDLQDARVNNTTAPQVPQAIGLHIGKPGLGHLIATLNAL